MSNIALTLNFGSPAEAADLFEAIAHAFRTVAARTNAAVAAVTVAAGEAVQSFAPATATGAGATATGAETGTTVAGTDGTEASGAAASRGLRGARGAFSTTAAGAAASPEPEKPGNITIDALRGMLKALMDRAEQVLGGGKGPLEALAIIAEFAPAGEKKISAIPAHLYGDAWDAIAKRTAAL